MLTPSRLALARKRRGFTKKRLAEEVGVSVRAVTGFESGEWHPTPVTIARFAAVLHFPISFFEAPDLEEISDDAASFRSLRKMTAAQRHAALSAGTIASDLHDWISSRFRLPTPDVPKIGPGVDPETAAEVVRTEWNLGEMPISNIIHLLEARGVRVFSLAEECREVDAFSLRRRDTPFVFLNTQKSSEHRRFDAAHELGHLVLHWHHDVPQGKQAEQEAHRFASALLMPRSKLQASGPRFATVQDLINFKKAWRVSASALAHRLHEVGVLTDWHYRTLCIDLAKRGYRTKEPKPIHPETSQVLAKVFAALRKEGVGKADIARSLHVYPEDLDSIVFGLAILPVSGEGAAGVPPPRAVTGLRLIEGGAD